MHDFLDKIWLDMHRASKHHTVLIFQGGGMRHLGWHRLCNMCLRVIVTDKQGALCGNPAQVWQDFWAQCPKPSKHVLSSPWKQWFFAHVPCHHSRVLFCKTDVLSTGNGQSIVPAGLLQWKSSVSQMCVQWRQLSVEWKLFEICKMKKLVNRAGRMKTRLCKDKRRRKQQII